VSSCPDAFTSRQRDCRWVHAIASPHAAGAARSHLGNQLAYEGISGDNIFLRDFPHDKYGIREIIPGWTALRHSANHLNFWGPRLPTTIDD
jgi:hypothetical protein